MSNTYDIMRLSGELEKLLLGDEGQRQKSLMDFPWVTLPAGYSFQPTFPFCGAAARFRVRNDDTPENSISVYLDTKDILGCVGSSYWEAYPIDGDIARFIVGEEKELVDCLVAELTKPPEQKGDLSTKNE